MNALVIDKFKPSFLGKRFNIKVRADVFKPKVCRFKFVLSELNQSTFGLENIILNDLL